MSAHPVKHDVSKRRAAPRSDFEEVLLVIQMNREGDGKGRWEYGEEDSREQLCSGNTFRVELD